MIRLHGFAQSGNTYKVALLLQALRLPWTAVHVPFADFAAGLTRSPAWRAEHNAMGEVPVLEDGARRLSQSAAIMIHLAERHGAYRGRDEDERQEVLRWLFFDNHKFTSHFATYRYMKAFGAAPPDPAVARWLLGRIDNAFDIADQHLAARAFVVGDAPTIADLSLCGYLFYPPEESGIDLPARFPAIAAWLERVRTLPGWQGPYDLLPGERVAPRW
jgi:glutathione S-transferase